MTEKEKALAILMKRILRGRFKMSLTGTNVYPSMENRKVDSLRSFPEKEIFSVADLIAHIDRLSPQVDLLGYAECLHIRNNQSLITSDIKYNAYGMNMPILFLRDILYAKKNMAEYVPYLVKSYSNLANPDNYVRRYMNINSLIRQTDIVKPNILVYSST
jgi:hypothetical protein